MGLFKKNIKNKQKDLLEVKVSDTDIVAMADGEMIDISVVSDPMFAKKELGDGIAFRYHGDKVVLCAPANGIISVLFPTGHAFGVTMKNGVELLVHCGVNTVETGGEGFKVLGKKQGDEIKAGDPIVEVELKKLKVDYDMSTMLIVTDANEQVIKFKDPKDFSRGESVILEDK